MEKERGKKKLKKILVLVDSYFPTGVAKSSRMLNFCRAFREVGYEVHVISAHSKGNEVVGAVYELEGITYEIVSKKTYSTLDSFVGTSGFLNRVKKYIDSNKVDCVFMTSSTEYFRRLSRIIKSRGTKCYVEQCEWLDLSNYKFGKFDLRYINAEFFRRMGAKRIDGVISISRLLDDYYRSVGVHSIRIPTILDIKNTKYTYKIEKRDKIHIVFAGSLGGSKELLKPIIETLAQNEYYRKVIVFDIYGPTKNQILTNIDGDTDLINNTGCSIVIHGRIPQEQIQEVYLNSDYLIFIRPQRKSSNAGFPTKLAESMAVGTPVITNNTGDISLYLENGKNGFLLSDNSTDVIRQCFDSIISTDENTYMQMRREARKTAENNFDFRIYMELIKEYFQST